MRRVSVAGRGWPRPLGLGLGRLASSVGVLGGVVQTVFKF